MTLEYTIELFWGVAFLVTGAPFCLTYVVADNVLECFAKAEAEIAMIQ